MLAYKSQQDACNGDAATTGIYHELFEGNEPRLIKDDEPLIIDAADTNRFLTFNDLRNKVHALATALRREPFNLQEGDVVAFNTTDSIDCYIILYAIACAGCIARFVKMHWSTEEMREIFSSGAPKAAIAPPDVLDFVRKVFPASIPTLVPGTSLSQCIQDSAKHRDSVPLVVHPETLAIILSSSGSTGNPKLVCISQRAMVERIRQEVKATGPLAIPPDGSIKDPRILGYSHPGSHSWLRLSWLCIKLGIPQYAVHYHPKYAVQHQQNALTDVDSILSKVEDFRITMINKLEAQILAQIAYHPPSSIQKYNLSTLRIIRSGGQAVPEVVFDRASRALDATIINFWSSTETSPVLSTSIGNYSYAKRGVFEEDPELHNIKIVGDDGQEVPDGVQGELWVKSPMNATGYDGLPELTKKAFDAQGYCHTGEIFVCNEGKYTVIGRQSDIIKTRPESFFPKPVEDLCLSYGGIKQCRIVGVFSSNHGHELPRAYIEPVMGVEFGHDDIRKMIAYVNERVPKQEMRLEGGAKVMQELPINKIGKIDKQKLREMARKEIGEEHDLP